MSINSIRASDWERDHCPHCGHSMAEHSNAREDDYACLVEGCNCYAWLPSERPNTTAKSLMARKAFWPGFKWRVLAHRRTDTGKAQLKDYVECVEFSSDSYSTPVEFDELVIDGWFHLEQMNDRDWWIGLGTAEDGAGYEWRINVHIDRDGKATVCMERDG